MSHFSVLVIGDNVEKQLAPYHEFECTGVDDEFVQTVDITEKARAKYGASKATLLRDPDGQLHEPWEDRFYREPTDEEKKKHSPMIGTGFGGGISFTSRDWNDGLGYRAKVRFVPDGWEEVQLPVSEVESFTEWAQDYYSLEPLDEGRQPDLAKKHKYGYVLVSQGEVVAVVDRTNPCAKWDWYELGGRWTGHFKVKPGRPSVVGRPRLMTEPAGDGYADMAKKSDIDFDGMRDEAGDKAAERWDIVHSVIDQHPPVETWEQARARFGDDVDQARKFYWGQPAVVALRDNKRANEYAGWERPDGYLVSREEYIQRERDGAITTFAVVKDGKWYERGEMGWWGVVVGEKDQEEWNRQFAALLDELPPDTMLAVVDCHI